MTLQDFITHLQPSQWGRWRDSIISPSKLHEHQKTEVIFLTCGPSRVPILAATTIRNHVIKKNSVPLRQDKTSQDKARRDETRQDETR